MIELIGGLGPNGKLCLIGVSSYPIELAPVRLIRGGKAIEVWAGVRRRIRMTLVASPNCAAWVP
jgi:hypothetical protein